MNSQVWVSGVQKLGYAIHAIIRLMRETGLPPTASRETARVFKVTLHEHRESLLGKQASAYLLDHQRITNRECREPCPDVSQETIRRHLADLAQKDILLKIGDKRGTFYIFKQ